ncbi:hypothetical protein GLOTRDRAFT_129675 [Gloeophyllum trabeum ATCC 11539]|uniref:Uncharacterized protein n=1 Tax=Gloeophyllum trabeum (strain ATCC 11539 / FP-39264 / Madison 617) TaxID=670483 RepID=S7RLX5_GLOTA|nr:uncharacterized protein GLOTRDRAFT_129675 [Gloeophyllum trabeum ATCC 11539]EPQ55400.1 hypothetical protein GLOTRDRAFT_129675 [Gloeophyllum trabeum ATCC 11539]
MDHSSELEDLQNENESLRRDLAEVENQRDRFMAEMMRHREKAARLESENERLQVTSFNLERSLRAARQESARLARATTTSDGRKALSTSTTATADSSKDHASASIVTQLPAPGHPKIKQEEVIDLTLDDVPDQQTRGVRRNPQTHSEGVGQHAISCTSSTGPSAARQSHVPAASSVSTLSVQWHSSPVSALAKSTEETSNPLKLQMNIPAQPTRLPDAVPPAPPPAVKSTANLVLDSQPAAARAKVEDAMSEVVVDSIVARPPALDFTASDSVQASNGLPSSRSSGAESPTLAKIKRPRTPENCTEVPEDRPIVSKRPRGDIDAAVSRSGPAHASSLSWQAVVGQSTGKYSSLAAANEALRTGAQVVHVLTLECTSFDEVLQALFTNPDAYDSLHSDTDDGSEYEP